MRLHDHLPGYPDAEQVAMGMQGVVYRLGAGKIAKVWFHAGTTELRLLADFYAALAKDGLGVRTPEILEVHEGPSYRVTVEAELPGVPLHGIASQYGDLVRDCLLEVLGELARVTVRPQLPVLDEVEPF